jgi:hypothetical protein
MVFQDKFAVLSAMSYVTVYRPPEEAHEPPRCQCVLLLGESARGSSYLLCHLEQLGCACAFATSSEEAITLIDRHAFYLILSTKPLHETERLVAALSGSDCTVFFSYPVEGGCWWLPLVRRGQKCLGAPAVRPSEFVGLLDRLVKEIESNETAVRIPGILPSQMDPRASQPQLRRWEHSYNTVRPHQALGYLRPHEFLERRRSQPKKAECH